VSLRQKPATPRVRLVRTWSGANALARFADLRDVGVATRPMKSTILLLGLLAIVWQASAEPSPHDAKPALSDYETVRTAESFSIGATGAAATITQTETSLRRILLSPTAAEDCRKLTVAGTPAGRLYGLLGLKILKDAAYPTAAMRHRFSRVEVSVTDACNISQRPTFFVVQLIDQGKIK
jgi:hypothetical protein